MGSSVIHLGDSNVPNTLVFIDKYTQVSRILGPLLQTLKNLDAACDESEGLKRYLESYGGIEKVMCRRMHLKNKDTLQMLKEMIFSRRHLHVSIYFSIQTWYSALYNSVHGIQAL